MRLLSLLVLLLILPGDGDKNGRRGNSHYKKQEYPEAALAYQEGLAKSSTENYALLSRLYNNLGSALHRQQDLEKASEAFQNALATADDLSTFSRTAYNAGNNAYYLGQASGDPSAANQQGQKLEEALNLYKRALLADPKNEDAKFNYEFVKRQLEQQQNQQQQQQQNQDQQDQQQQEQDQQQQEQDQQQQDQQQQEQDQQEQEQQQQEQQEQEQDQQEQEQQQQEQQPKPDPRELTKEEAERILQALQTDEKELLREVLKLKTPPRKVKKDW